MSTAKPVRRWRRRLLLAVGVLLGVAAVGGGWLVYQLRAGLPQLRGSVTLSGLDAAVEISRDALGVPTVTAAGLEDAVSALGFVHAQERFFQMDLLRRYAAGELAALAGEGALAQDRARRVHRFRHRAKLTLRALPAAEQALLTAYSTGVNAGLAALAAVPFEYWILGAEPQPWRAEDSLLAVYAMYLRLQILGVAQERLLGVLYRQLPPALYRFLTPWGSSWDAPLDASRLTSPALPNAAAVDFRRWPSSPAGALPPSAVPGPAGAGSNAWALAGARSAHGGALLANDMHLDLQLPNIWYRAALRYPVADRQVQVTGVTLPGAPGVVVGSSGTVAWGFTNSYGDWADLVVVEPSDEEHYRTPDGPERWQRYQEWIDVNGAEPQPLIVTETRWGPLVGADGDGRPLALRWVAHDPPAVNLALLGLAAAPDLDAALTIANRSGTPAQNILIADRSGRIGWTLTGPIPRRIGFNGRRPQSWSDGLRGWAGWLAVADYPRVVDPPEGRLWSANARPLGGTALERLGDGGYAMGIRAAQIRDRLRDQDAAADEAGQLALQLDDRALWLERWRSLALDTLDPDAVAGRPRRAELARLLRAWNGRADAASVAYPLLRELRANIARRVFEPVNARLGRADPPANYLAFRHFEQPLWRLLQERPAHLLNRRFSDWKALLLDAVDALLAGRETPDRPWGEQNRLLMRHPLSPHLPLLGRWLDMPAVPLPGGVDVPRVQLGSKGASQRMVVSPGREELGIFHMPGGQSGHPLSPFYNAGHHAWLAGKPAAFLPGAARYRLQLLPKTMPESE